MKTTTPYHLERIVLNRMFTRLFMGVACLIICANSQLASGQVVVPPGFSVRNLDVGIELDGLAAGPGNAFGTDLYAGVDGGVLRIDPNTGNSTMFVTGLSTGGSRPSGLAFDTGFFGTGDLFVVQNGGTVVQVTSAGQVTNFSAGNTLFSPNDLAFGPSGSFGNMLFVSNGEFFSGTITAIDSTGTNSTFATIDQFPGGSPIGLDFPPIGSAFGSGLFASVVGGTISQITSTGTASTFATGLGLPIDFRFGGNDFGDFLYVTDSTTESILKVDPSGNVSTFATGFAFSSTGFDGDITFSGDGKTMYVSNNGQVVVITASGQLLNISTRLRVLTDDNVLIGGFIITGIDPKRVIVRGIGPSLISAGVPDALADPTIELHDGSGATIATNDNWKVSDTGGSQQAEIEATTIPPTNDLESALVMTLPAGNASYTAVLRGKNNATGIGLVEAYDLDTAANSLLANISTRGFVDVGDNVLIGGFISGNGVTKVIVRAIGPSLTAAGVTGALQDPTLELHDGNGATIATNDNWKVSDTGGSQQAEIEATTIPPTDDNESALVRSLVPGNYTAIVRGKDNTTGVGLVEAYNIP